MTTTTAMTTTPAAPRASFFTAALLGLGLVMSAASSAMAQANDATVPCNNPTNNPEGDSELCYIGPRPLAATAQRRRAEDPYRARGQANSRHSERRGKVQLSGE